MTTPQLLEAVGRNESEATARQRLACRRAGVAYVPPAPTSQQPPWEGHPEDVLFSDVPTNNFPRLFAWLVAAALILGAGAGILWK